MVASRVVNLDSIKLPNQWKVLLRGFLESQTFENIRTAYLTELKTGKTLYPPPSMLFKTFFLTLPKDVKVVILGQDPYHGAINVTCKDGLKLVPQAMGLSFSVPKPLAAPPSLKNIYTELARTCGFIPPDHGDLSVWGERGVLLLNAILSVEANKPASHKGFGWESFSDEVIKVLSENFEGIVFMLWGNYAKKKASLINQSKHCVLTAPHPSPLARGFVGSDVFLKAKQYWLSCQKEPLDWNLE